MAATAALAAAPLLTPGAPPHLLAWPTRADLKAEIENFFLPGNNQEWAQAQLLHLHQGPHQCIDNFLAQFKMLKVQSCCVDEYARDDLKEDFPPKKGRLILLSVDEQKEVKSFLDDQLAKGYIRPSISQQTSPVFLFPKRMARSTWYRITAT